ncbi:DNA-binding protein [Venturia inaequalis]|nr:DNA-binding protein [Venturia inaequalis]
MKVITTLVTISSFANLGLCIVGTAAPYRPPYSPTKCYGGDQSKFPPIERSAP